MLGPVFRDNMLAKAAQTGLQWQETMKSLKFSKNRSSQQHKGQAHKDSVDQQQDGTLRKTLWT